MADFIFLAAAGAWRAYLDRAANNDDPNAVVVAMLMEAVETDAALNDRTDFANILAQGGNTESAASGYARITLDDTQITPQAPDAANNRVTYDIDDIVFAALVSGNNAVKLILGIDFDSTGGTDANIIPIAAIDVSISPDPNPVTIAIDSAGIFRATAPIA